MEMIASIFTMPKRRATYVPSEPSFTKEQILLMMRDAEVGAVIWNI